MNLRLFVLISSTFLFGISETKDIYKGTLIGSFSSNSKHKVSGKMYAIDETIIFIEEFTYDGLGPNATFWGGTSVQPTATGFAIPDYLGRTLKLKAHDKQNVLLKMPNKKKIKDIKWIAVWSNTENFGHINIPTDFESPKTVNLGKLPNFAHDVYATAVTFKDAKTLEIKGLNYDGSAPDTYFLVGTGDKPHNKGTKVPDENGSTEKIKAYKNADVMLRLPGDLTIANIDWFGIYCVSYSEDFGHVLIPKNVKDKVPADIYEIRAITNLLPNCEPIFADLLQVYWEIVDTEIYIKIEGRYGANQYLAFGLSGDQKKSMMVGADVAVAYFDFIADKAVIQDYYLTEKAQCNPTANSGACPDTKITNGTDDLELISWTHMDSILSVVYKRDLDTDDETTDQSIVPNEQTAVVAAVGPLNSLKETAFHFINFTKSSNPPIIVTFGRKPNANCKALFPIRRNDPSSGGTVKTWKPQKIEGQTTLRAQIGPTGGIYGYSAVTGIQGWGIAWWINEMLIPEIHVERHQNYTFIVEGGTNASTQAHYHPFYITNNKEGGGNQFPDALGKPDHIIYAGIHLLENGSFDVNQAIGRYCEWKHADGVDQAAKVSSVEEYKKTLKLECEDGSPGTFHWMPDEHTPSVVYYQCFTHRNLGWKIVVGSANFFKASPVILLVLFFMSRIFM